MTAHKAITLGHPSYVWRAGQERRYGMIARNVALENARVLDVGCGLGLYLQRFRQDSAQVYGVDVDADKVELARKTLPNIQQSPAEQLPFDDAFFDVVLSHEVLEHVTDDRQAVREAYRILKPGGHLIVFVPNRLYPFETHGFYWRGTYRFGNIPLINYLPNKWRNRLCPHVRAYTTRGLLDLFNGLAGRVTVHQRVFAGYDNIIERAPRLGYMIRRVSYMLEHTPFQVFGLSHFLVFQKAIESPSSLEARQTL